MALNTSQNVKNIECFKMFLFAFPFRLKFWTARIISNLVVSPLSAAMHCIHWNGFWVASAYGATARVARTRFVSSVSAFQ